METSCFPSSVGAFYFLFVVYKGLRAERTQLFENAFTNSSVEFSYRPSYIYSVATKRIMCTNKIISYPENQGFGLA